ncbi:LuxR C-terminal-related transcriptional regulator [Streptomyces rhizosphaerihabitans]|uniref:LuxR C-terminal-related transcriptional regulator n=1 Tax=Streptomyces rhizosphaerihabitans TaxID=1266770 RepID=UPI0021C163E1|nr:LuxR C-terminal-related transcriptional regulator [Streptomyces rhizosphaerihabitans]MCT9010506.1 LuxR C-terminal-related transcriptional regulator [Streptomyces rhizosphaerihabitans]
MDGDLEIGDTDRKILRLLYSGLDDTRVAMELGVSHRTVQRRVQSLMSLLGARGRLALGARAQEAGLLYAPDRVLDATRTAMLAQIRRS